jgi:hypothetical protein
MTYHILPKLKVNNNVQNINQSGTWAVRTRDLLDKLSKGLKVDKVETEINSIPDMWARPMLFEMALFDQEHVLHERILGEWRGLLAMVGLKEVAKLTRLTVAQVKVPVILPARDGEEETDVQQRDFMRTLSKLLPGTSLSDDTTWRTLYVFLFNGQPVGMTSPTTLVATAADYLNRISNQEVAWYNGTHLKDPVGVLSPRQKEILSGWLSMLRARIGAHQGTRSERWNPLSRLLKEFADQLGAGTCTLNQSGFGIAGPEAGIFKYLDKPADGNLQDASHVRVIPSDGRAPAKSLLVFDKGIAEQWEMVPQDVTVQGAQTLASARLDVTDADVWKAEDFFTKKLFVVFQENAFPGTVGPGTQSVTLPGGSTKVTPILPIRAELMNHLTGEDLAERVRWDQTTEGLRIRLFLKLSGPDATNPGKTIELARLYKHDDIQTLNNVPILEIWPNFRALGWKAYYTCYSTEDSSSTFDAKPLTFGKIIASETPLKGRGQRRYWRTETYPEAMVCNAFVSNPQGNQMELQNAGLLLLTQPEGVRTRGTSYEVGVDFGAANTTVCARLGEESFPVDFANMKVSITATSDAAQAELIDFFLPRQESKMPLLSIFHSFDNTVKGLELQALLNGHIYLLPGDSLFGESQVGQAGMAFDLKWSSKDQDRRMVKAFLSQLCLQTCAELVSKGATSVSWAFSYPTAFSEAQIEGFPGIWDQVTTECVALSGLTRGRENKRKTESIAAAQYFVDHLSAPTAEGAIFIDIGGSTADISVWQEKIPVWQTSVLLAGRNLFSDYLWYNPEFLTAFGPEFSQLPIVRNMKATDRRPFYAQTDVLLRDNSERIFNQLPVNAGTEQVRALRQHLALGVSGLLYYVGSLLQYLITKQIYRKTIPNVYVGGNGSRIFRWLDIDGEQRMNPLYRTMLAQGAGWDEKQSFRVAISPEPKKEAAYGLVQDDHSEPKKETADGPVHDDDPKAGNISREVLSGESFIAEGMIDEWQRGVPSTGEKHGKHKLNWNDLLTAEAFTKKLSPPPVFERLTDFLNTYNRIANSQGLVSSVSLRTEHLEELRRRLGQSLSRYRDVSETANVVVEPVFIMTLRHWLEIRLED